MAAPKVACPDVYAGNGGVKLLSPGRGLLACAPRGVQLGSPTVAGLPVAAALRIPRIGRQKLSWYFRLQQVIPASAMAIFRRANKRAFCSTVLFSCSAT